VSSFDLKISRLAVLLLVATTSIALCGGVCADNASAAKRVILLFVVNSPDPNAKSSMQSWVQAFQINLRHVLGDFSSATTDPVISIDFRSQSVDDVPADSMLASSFDSQPSLQVLSAVGQVAGQSTFVENDIYLGDLKGSLAKPYIFLSREIVPKDYARARDAITVVTLYAYAMALAKALPQDNRGYIVCRILDQAHVYGPKGTQALGDDVQGYLDVLFHAISAELESRSCGGKS
jgi:hypothetical protein